MNGASISELVNGYKLARVLLTAVELQLFDAIESTGSDGGAIAACAGTDIRATERLLNVLVSQGLLSSRAGRYYHSEASARFLDSRSPEYLANLHHSVHLWDSWSTLTTVIRKGGPDEARFKAREKPERTESFIQAMHHLASGRAKETLSHLDLSRVSRVLDIGGGSGAYAIALMEAIGPSGRATILDLPSVLPLTAQYVDAAGLGAQIETVVGDYRVDALPTGYDLVLLSAIVHINSEAENRALIGRAADALNAGGQVVVRDFFADEDRSGPLPATLFAINMLVNTEGGDTYTETEMRAWFKDAGLSDVRRVHQDVGAGLLVGTRAC
jgi:SAM-dependent methyltransferase